MTTTPDQFAHIPLDQIVSSLTNPRKTFSPQALEQLANSIAATGVHQPVLLRPLTGERLADTAGMNPRPAYELVSGERRYRACEQLGKPSIPAIIRAITDSQALEIQIIENLQRADLAPLEEAEGFEHLRTHHEPPLSAEQIGQRIGKSKSYVYGRLKLLALGVEGKLAMQEGWLPGAYALLIARLPDTKVQAEALANLRDYSGELLGLTNAAHMIERQYMLRLNTASFSRASTSLLPAAGSCEACPKRTGADPDLFADIKGGAELCLSPPCFQAKQQAHQAQQHQAARESGATIIEGREAKALIPLSYTGRVEGHLRLDDPEDSPTGKPLRSIIGKLMEAEGIKPTLVANPHREGELIAVVDHATASRLLAQKGHQDQADAIQAKVQESAKDAERAQAEKDKQAFEEAWRWAVLEAAWAGLGKLKDSYALPTATLLHLAHSKLPNTEGCKRLCKLLGLGTVAPAAAMADWLNDEATNLETAIALLVMYGDREHITWGPPEGRVNQRLMDIATDLTVIDVDAIKAEVQKEHTARIKARKKTAAEAAAKKADPPLSPAAQASGERGADKTKTKPRAAPKPKAREKEVRQGIAAAMQGNEGRADDGPAGSDPDGYAVGEEGPATAPDAGAAPASNLSPEVAWPFPTEARP
jgi:ParB/RepB/Spo0J family partition protein